MTDARVLTDQSQFLFVFQGLKGTLTAREVARAGSAVARELRLDFQSVIGSDGGDGLLDALVGSLAATTRHTVSGPSGEPVQADIGWLSDGTAVIESRMACGAP
ncbi:MAG: glycerate kinase, partial [Gemmatimonadales bacterium]